MIDARAKMREVLAEKLKGYQQFQPFVYMLLYSPKNELTKFLDAAVQAGVNFAEGAARAAADAETTRCAGIVQRARFGEIDTDWRSILHRIENHTPADED